MGKRSDNQVQLSKSQQLPSGNNNSKRSNSLVDDPPPGCFSVLGAVLSRRSIDKRRSIEHGGALEENPFVASNSSSLDNGQLERSGEKAAMARGLPEGTDEHERFLMDEEVAMKMELFHRATSAPSFFNGQRDADRRSFRDQGTSATSLDNTEQRHYTERALSACNLGQFRGGEPLLYTQSDLDAVIMARSEDLQKKNEELQAKLKSDRVAVGGKEEKLRNELNEMKRIVGEYEKTIVSLTENSQRDTMAKDETLSDLIKEKEQLRVDLNTAESGLLDAYRRVETLNKAVESYRANEGQLKASIDNHKGLLQRSEERYEKLKKHAEEKLDFANKEIGKVRKSKEVDLAGLEATVKKWQAKAATLEQSLNQKVTENEELTKICDDLISRVSSQGN